MRARFPLLVLAAVAAAPLLALVAGPAGAQSSASVGDSSEAWYATNPVVSCSSPVGCPPVSLPTAQPYAANTLHVSATAGQETARSYVQPNLSALPFEDIAQSGTMTLPLATVTANGNSNPDTATIEACLVTAAFSDGTAGSTSAPPATDCKVHVALKPGASAFTLDLTPFLDSWNAGRPEFGVALIPVLSSTSVATWHVAFNGRNLPGAPHISSTFVLTPLPATSLQGPQPMFPPVAPATNPASGTPPPSTLPATAPAVTQPPDTGTIPAPAPAIAQSAPTTAPVTTFVPARSRGFQYPEIMLLPIAFAAGLIFVIRLLTSDATPRRKAA